MEKSFDRILVTAALPYANGPIHIGHLAGCYLPADIYCRYQRLKGRDIAFICGSDEHGVPIILRARDEGVTPKDIVDRYHAIIEKSFRDFGMSFDYYGRTSSKTHHETSQAWFARLDQKGSFFTRTELQFYDAAAEMFLADRFIRGTCPHCKYEDAYGDQCEKCGRSLSPADLESPRSAITNTTPEKRETTHWYMPLGKLQPALELFIESHADWKPNVLGQVKSWLKEGLADRAVTRDLPWGVPVPAEAAKRAGVDASGKVIYVWIDAPIGYVSATREWGARDGEPDRWKRYWQDPKSRLIHFIGKDNIVFHCLIFPALLMEHGDYVLPDNVPANEFLNLEGNKLSTSRGFAVWLHELLERFPADYVRFGLARIFPENKDADFSFKEFQGHINNELADTLGNFVNRTLSFAVKNMGGKLPALVSPSEADTAALEAIEGFVDRVGEHLEAFRFRDALSEAMGLARLGNKYVNDAAPWATLKTDPQLAGNTIHVALQISAALSVLFEPFLPASCREMQRMLGLSGMRSSEAGSPNEGRSWDDAKRLLLEAGQELGEPHILFRKLDDDIIAAELDKLKKAAPSASGQADGAASGAEAEPYVDVKDPIEYDDFAKLDLRVGVVTAAELVPKSKKLIRTEIDFGFETRQVLAGVAQQMKPEALLGRRVIVVANLKPRKMAGLESQGMILMAEGRDGVLAPLSAECEPGSTVS